MGLFVACCGGDDDPVEVDDSWKNLSKTYQVDENEITLAGALTVTLSGEGRSVTVSATSAEAAKLTLTNIVPDGAAISIDGGLTKANDLYSITGETTINGCKIAVSGNFDADGKLTLAVTRTMTTPITGDWKLLITEEELLPEEAPGVTIPYVPVYWKAVTGDAEIDAELKGDGIWLGIMIANSVTAVDVTFSPEGTFDVTWTKVGETTPTGMPLHVLGFLGNIFYVVRDGAVFIALDGSIVGKALDMVAPILEEAGISNVDGILHSLMPLTGGYYVLPIAYEQTEGVTIFKLEKAQLLTVLEILAPLLAETPEDLAEFEQHFPLLLEARELEFGLPFVK
jgi:hypothetical protein